MISFGGTPSIGALLFVRVDSDGHVPSLDWVTGRERLEVGGEEAEWQIPTAVQLCEFLRFLELSWARTRMSASHAWQFS